MRARLQLVPVLLLGELLGAGEQLHHRLVQQLEVAAPQQESPVHPLRALTQHVLRRQTRLQVRQKPVLPIGEVHQVLLEVLELRAVELREPAAMCGVR